MSEAAAIERVDEPNTVSSLATELRDLGVQAGDTLLVHSSLSALGWVCGGAQAVVDALQAVVTESGTLAMPTHTTQYSDPAGWSNPPVPDAWVDPIRASMPPFRPDVTPTRGMGAIAECFRSYPDVVRSRHPEFSFAAWGADADGVTGDHPYDHGLGEGSPLARVYERGGRVLMLGVGHEVNTSLHLAESRADFDKRTIEHSAPVMEEGRRVRVTYEDIERRSGDFAELGADFEEQVGLTEGDIGAATAKLIDQRPLVDFAVAWFDANR